MNFIEGIGRNLFDRIIGIRHFLSFTGSVLKAMISFYSDKRTTASVIVKQVYFTGYEALLLIGFIALAFGGVIILQGNIMLSGFGQTKWVYVLLVTVVIRELSSVVTALIVIARSGTSISTELGNMVVNNEIELLKSYGISPINYLVISRVIGVVAATFTLTIYFNLTAVIGGWFFSNLFFPIPFGDFFSNLIGEIHIWDIILSVVKSIVFGISIALISCYQGLQVVKATTEVPQRTIRAVVHSIIVIVIANVLLTYVYYLLLWG